MFEIRLIACAAMLVTASILDLKNREIGDRVWIGFGSLGGLLTAIEFNSNAIDLIQYAMRVAITAPVAYAIYRTGLFGGADAKALVAIAVLLPFYDMQFKMHDLTAFTVLTNATILTFAHIFHNVIRNSIDLARGKAMFAGFQESAARKALAFLMGFRSDSAKGYLFAMECSEGGRRRFNFHPASYDEYVANAKNVWVTPAIPFIVYMAFGFALMIIFGDLLALVFTNIWIVLGIFA
ncbi:MAG: A24 family peptidase C-terminal domain-containing protein [Nitrososphaerales archaeon]